MLPIIRRTACDLRRAPRRLDADRIDWCDPCGSHDARAAGQPDLDGRAYELDLDAPPEEVWRLWIDPERMRSLDGRPGARSSRGPAARSDRVRERRRRRPASSSTLEAPRAWAFTWGWDEAGALDAGRARRASRSSSKGSRTTRGPAFGCATSTSPPEALDNHDAGWRSPPRLAAAVSDARLDTVLRLTIYRLAIYRQA